METTPIQISHERLVQLKLIEKNQLPNNNQTSYFIYEIDDNRWQNTEPDGQTDYDLLSIKQEPARLPIGILTIDQINNTFSFEGDLTVTQDDLNLLFLSVN